MKPWEFEIIEEENGTCFFRTKFLRGTADSFSLAQRMFACVNACAEIQNPVAVPTVVEALKELVRAIDTSGVSALERALDKANAALAALNKERAP